MTKTDSAVDRYYDQDFLDELGKAGPPSSTPASLEVSSLWGTKPTKSFAHLFDFLGRQKKAVELGEFGSFKPKDWLAGKANAFDFMMPEFFRRAALLSGTVAIGRTGCGDIWLVDPMPIQNRHRVFLLDHSIGALYPIADSLESLAWLCHLIAQDDEASPADWKLLAKRVRGYNDIEVPKNVEPLPADTDVIDRFKAAKDLYQALWFGGAPAPVSPPADSHPATLIAHALRAFLHGEDTVLKAALERAKQSPSRLLLDMGKSLTAKLKVRGAEARLEALGSKR